MLFCNKCNRSSQLDLVMARKTACGITHFVWKHGTCSVTSGGHHLILASSAAFLASFGRTKHCGTKQSRRGGSPQPTNLVVSTHTALVASASGSLCFNLWELHQVRIFYVIHTENTNEYAWVSAVFKLHITVYRSNNKNANFEHLLNSDECIMDTSVL